MRRSWIKFPPTTSQLCRIAFASGIMHVGDVFKVRSTCTSLHQFVCKEITNAKKLYIFYVYMPRLALLISPIRQLCGAFRMNKRLQQQPHDRLEHLTDTLASRINYPNRSRFRSFRAAHAPPSSSKMKSVKSL